jgi:hypothetical protein
MYHGVILTSFFPVYSIVPFILFLP